ncbi:hypothetical protein DESUT3_17920 [Desulfuromonas versatilis]|uniref:DUF2231 domain-containing protein n=1 Tax=Desulfuromonas versatilis TaxID=2802975 RepID=A0ABM8HR21_9BACT|nr:DUF2231 domain-containing protein [Desulfuromonas versatilis]BCR04723.1 hypothetical protein DESUT3_17920 [Desulfuromonas versatilis]
MRKIKIHMHAISVHFANGLIPTSLLFLFLFLLTGNPDLEKAVFFTLLVGTAGIFATLVTGLVEWRKDYQGAWVPVFKKKLFLGLLALVAGLGASALRWLFPQLLYTAEPLSWLFVLLELLCCGAAAWAGYLGGRLVFH